MSPRQRDDLERLSAELKALSWSIADLDNADRRPSAITKARQEIAEAHQALGSVLEKLDPIKHPGFVFDPSNPAVAGRVAAVALLAQERRPLGALGKFYGSGVYAIYYNGPFAAYSAISRKEHPIYVGKADPEDPSAKTPPEQGPRLAGRLNDHKKNISKARTTLSLDDFEYRALTVQTGWQGSAEEYLIHLFKPIWNSEVDICYGFGKHGDDPGTRANLRSPWDTLHPGRDWAHRDPRMKDAREQVRIVADIAEHLRTNPPLDSTDEILRRFLSEMRAVS